MIKAEASNRITGEIYQIINIIYGHITIWNYSNATPCPWVGGHRLARDDGGGRQHRRVAAPELSEIIIRFSSC